jgi:hypothetical protein
LTRQKPLSQENFKAAPSSIARKTHKQRHQREESIMQTISKMSVAVYVLILGGLIIGLCPALALAFEAPAEGSFAFSV